MTLDETRKAIVYSATNLLERIGESMLEEAAQDASLYIGFDNRPETLEKLEDLAGDLIAGNWRALDIRLAPREHHEPFIYSWEAVALEHARHFGEYLHEHSSERAAGTSRSALVLDAANSWTHERAQQDYEAARTSGDLHECCRYIRARLELHNRAAHSWTLDALLTCFDSSGNRRPALLALEDAADSMLIGEAVQLCEDAP